MRSTLVFGSILLFVGFISTAHAKNSDTVSNVSVGRLYVLSEHGIIQKDRLQHIADMVEKNFSAVGIIYSKANAVDTFPHLKPLDALVIYLDTDMAPKDIGSGRDDCPLTGIDVGESDVLTKQSYNQMKERLEFKYDVETVRGSVVYICPGRLLLTYKLLRMLAAKEDGPLTEKNIDSIWASAATHEIGHTLGAVHVYKYIDDSMGILTDGYFMGSVVTYADDVTKFHENNVEKMKEFIRYSNGLRGKNKMQTMNDKKTSFLRDFILQ